MKIFIADYLPIKNKGEEALLRGIQSLYEEKYQNKVEFFVFGPVNKIKQEGDITIFPVNWCYPQYQKPQLFEGRLGVIRRLLCAFLFRFGFFPYVRRISKHPEAIKALKTADVILIAHDGFYNTFCAGLGLYLKKNGLHYSVPGTGFMPVSKYSFANKKLDRFFFNYSCLNVLREETCYQYLRGLNLAHEVYLLPDMAFYCKSTPDEIKHSKELIDKYGICTNDKCVNIGLTICENSISFHGSFLKSKQKTEDHRTFISKLLDKIAEEINCRFIFIPHCIEEGLGNDLIISEDIKHRMKHGENSLIIKEDLPVNVLRPFIQSLDFMIGERTHSIINSTSMCTPYFMLTSSLDFRSHDIIGKGIGLPEQIIDLDNPNLRDVVKKIVKGIRNREQITAHLESYKKVVSKSREQLLELI